MDCFLFVVDSFLFDSFCLREMFVRSTDSLIEGFMPVDLLGDGDFGESSSFLDI